MSAAQFTNIRAESQGWDFVTVRYDYAGTNAISLWRAPNGGAFAKLFTIPADYGSYPTFNDTSVVAETYYDYKLSDDNGVTFTAIVSVQTQKQFPIISRGSGANTQQVALPSFPTDESINPPNVQQMVDQLQALLNGETIAAPRPCQVCPSNGALVLDCSTGCYRFIIDPADITDVNSISINCESLELDFNVPDSTTIEVCGWPENAGFTGDECFQAPISSGVGGFQVITRPKTQCQNERTRLMTTPCIKDYQRDCYDTGSLIWPGSKLALSVDDCPATGGGIDQTSWADASGTLTVFSGNEAKGNYVNRKANPLAGFSLAYKALNTHMAGNPGTANIFEFTVNHLTGDRIITKLKGSPIVGMAINVPQGATTVNFTGRVLLWNYRTSTIVYGSYANANLHNGDLPTVIASTALVETAREAVITVDNTAGGTYSATNAYINDDSVQLFSTPRTSITLSGSEPLGAGFIWVANPDFGVHAASIKFTPNSTSYLAWWG